MKKLVILLFLFLGGLCLVVGTNSVCAVDIDSKSSIYFTDTYVYTPTSESGNLNGVTPTGNPPRNGSQKLPKTGESINRNLVQIGGILLLVSSFILKNYWKRELNNENK
ncbi:hypothetical protein IGL98_001251 [Enterococcus sp. DIV0840]|uniref:LPXTG cell wall anchor domain-containing protein n=1 Tax=Enterococcus TaxID=1350 RepID=UPI001A8F4B5D|nr:MULTISPECIES: LPXTG cell wall anchor domain-containing protein [Enterococcus]MBO0435305.1 LPXTG cell wall anchor domain-containing protein [Enterococcus sp. DIV0849a]MBO0474725.1 LPXTG cell wall anchor domain-containing protein [Enterococcus ureasiticus]